MSIIYDALKKIDKSADNNSILDKPLTKSPKKKKAILLYILIILAGLFVGNLVFNLFMRTNKAKSAPTGKIPEAILQKEASTMVNGIQEIMPPPLPAPVFTLNGVFFQADKGYALINNRIMNVGDKIEGATVKEISLEKVDLDFDGRTITLNNSSR